MPTRLHLLFFIATRHCTCGSVLMCLVSTLAAFNECSDRQQAMSSALFSAPLHAQLHHACQATRASICWRSHTLPFSLAYIHSVRAELTGNHAAGPQTTADPETAEAHQKQPETHADSSGKVYTSLYASLISRHQLPLSAVLTTPLCAHANSIPQLQGSLQHTHEQQKRQSHLPT